MVILETSSHSLPRILPMPPIVGWMDMTIALLISAVVLRLVLNNLQDHFFDAFSSDKPQGAVPKEGTAPFVLGCSGTNMAGGDGA